MEHNDFLLRGLSAMPDHLLFRAFSEYRQAHALLVENEAPHARDVQAQLEEALAKLSAELRERGIAPQAVRK